MLVSSSSSAGGGGEGNFTFAGGEGNFTFAGGRGALGARTFRGRRTGGFTPPIGRSAGRLGLGGGAGVEGRCGGGRPKPPPFFVVIASQFSARTQPFSMLRSVSSAPCRTLTALVGPESATESADVQRVFAAAGLDGRSSRSEMGLTSVQARSVS